MGLKAMIAAALLVGATACNNSPSPPSAPVNLFVQIANGDKRYDLSLLVGGGGISMVGTADPAHIESGSPIYRVVRNEAPADYIRPGDSFIVTGPDNRSSIMHYAGIDETAHTLTLFDLASTGQIAVPFDPVRRSGLLSRGAINYGFFVGADGSLALDQDADGVTEGSKIKLFTDRNGTPLEVKLP